MNISLTTIIKIFEFMTLDVFIHFLFNATIKHCAKLNVTILFLAVPVTGKIVHSLLFCFYAVEIRFFVLLGNI